MKFTVFTLYQYNPCISIDVFCGSPSPCGECEWSEMIGEMWRPLLTSERQISDGRRVNRKDRITIGHQLVLKVCRIMGTIHRAGGSPFIQVVNA